ncbi:hypothetical protein MMC30_006319 [Trapelia coarctata]|nr:hypothetical protein [Trapelia coarctata]
MRPIPRLLSTLLSAAFLFPSLALAIGQNCESIVADGAKFNLKNLDGVHSVSSISTLPPGKLNSTFTLNICAPLKKPKGPPKEDTCASGTYVCGYEQKIHEDGTLEPKPLSVIPIAGEYSLSNGGALDPHYTRLKTSPSHADSRLEGLRMELRGGKYLKKKQKAVIEFLCSRDGDNATKERDDEEGEDKGKDNGQEEVDDGQGGRLKFLSYDDVEDTTVLRLQWKTEYACEDAKDVGGKSGGWGFFSWFFFIIFLSLLGYLIFGSWLNYNRYGARGWDLLPHGDTIRDVPYILQDWFRKVVDTVQGGHSRGGYSAV